MSQNAVPHSFSEISVPSKAFLLGEYAVLHQKPALVACLEPRFKFGLGGEPFHAESPAGKFLKQFGDLNFGTLEDPFRGAGGFGASTAQFAAAYEYCTEKNKLPRNWKSPWKIYREMTNFASSGADLVAQWNGGVTLFDPSKLTVEDVGLNFDWSGLYVFSATSQKGRKVNTHDHLKDISPLSDSRKIDALAEITLNAIHSIKSSDERLFGKSLTRYAEILFEFGLEVEKTTQDRKAFLEIPGVIGAKGVGAMQSDAIIVLLDDPGKIGEQVIQIAEKRGLRLVSKGLRAEKGIQVS